MMRRSKPALAAVAFVSSGLLLTGTTTTADAASGPHHFKNCDAMHKRFAHGVGKFGAKDHTSGDPVTNFKRAPRWYAKNTSLDRDKDHIACEAH